MEKDIIWTCTVCNKVPTRQSARKCPWCGGKLTAWDRCKDPIERQPDWPKKDSKTKEPVQDNNRIDYSQYYEKAKKNNG